MKWKEKLLTLLALTALLFIGAGAASARDEDPPPRHITGALPRYHGDRFKRIPEFGDFDGDNSKLPFPFPFENIGDEGKLYPGGGGGSGCSDCTPCKWVENDDGEKWYDCRVVQHPVPRLKSPMDFKHEYEVTNHYIPWPASADNVYGAYRATVAIDVRDTTASLQAFKTPPMTWRTKGPDGKKYDKPHLFIGSAAERTKSFLWDDSSNLVKSDVVVITDFPLVAGKERYEVRGSTVFHYIDRYYYETPRWVVGYVHDVSPAMGSYRLERVEADRRVVMRELKFASAAEMNPNYVRFGADPPVRTLYRRDGTSVTSERAPLNPIDNFWPGGYVPGGEFISGEWVHVASYKGFSLSEFVSWHWNDGMWTWVEPPKLTDGAVVTVRKNFSIDTLTETGTMNLSWWNRSGTDGWGMPTPEALHSKAGTAHVFEYGEPDYEAMLKDAPISAPFMPQLRRFDANTCGRALISSEEMRELHRKSAFELASKILATDLRLKKNIFFPVPEWGRMLPFMRAGQGRMMGYEPAGLHSNVGGKQMTVRPSPEADASWLWPETVRYLSRALPKGKTPDTMEPGFDNEKTWDRLFGTGTNAEKILGNALSSGYPFWNIVEAKDSEYRRMRLWNDPLLYNESGEESRWREWDEMLPAYYRDMLPYVSRALGMLLIPQFGRGSENGVRDGSVFWGNGMEYDFRPNPTYYPEEEVFLSWYDESDRRKHYSGRPLTEQQILDMWTLFDRSYYRKALIDIPEDVDKAWKRITKDKDSGGKEIGRWKPLPPKETAAHRKTAANMGRHMVYPGAGRETNVTGYSVSASGIASIARIFPMNPVDALDYANRARAFEAKPDHKPYSPVWYEAPPNGQNLGYFEEYRGERHRYYYYLDGTSNMNVDAFAENPDCACVDTTAAVANAKYLVAPGGWRKKFGHPKVSGLYTPQLFDPPSRRFIPTQSRGTIYFFGVDFGMIPPVPDVTVYGWKIGGGRLDGSGNPVAPVGGNSSFTKLRNLRKVGSVPAIEQTGDVEGRMPDDAWVGSEIDTFYKDMEVHAKLLETVSGDGGLDPLKFKPNLAELSFSSWRDYRGLWSAKSNQGQRYDVLGVFTELNGYGSWPKSDLPPYAKTMYFPEMSKDQYIAVEKTIRPPVRYPYPGVYDGISDDGKEKVCGPDPMVRIPAGDDRAALTVWEGDKGPFCKAKNIPVYPLTDTDPPKKPDAGRGRDVFLNVYKYGHDECGPDYRIGDSFALGVNSDPHYNELYNRFRPKRPLPAGTDPWIWNSSKPNVADVERGLVTCLSPGKATIRVSFRQYPSITATYAVECKKRDTARFVRETKDELAFPAAKNGYFEVYDRPSRMASFAVPKNGTPIASPFEPATGLQETRFDVHGFDVGAMNRLEFAHGGLWAAGSSSWSGDRPVVSLVDPASRALDVYSVFGTSSTYAGSSDARRAYAELRENMKKRLERVYVRGYRVKVLLDHVKPSWKDRIMSRWNALLDDIPIRDVWIESGRLRMVGAISMAKLESVLFPSYYQAWSRDKYKAAYAELAKFYNRDGLKYDAIAARTKAPGLFSIPVVGSFTTGMAHRMLELHKAGELDNVSPQLEAELEEIKRVGESGARNEYLKPSVAKTADFLAGNTKTVRKSAKASLMDVLFRSIFADPVPPGQATHRKRYFVNGEGDFVVYVPHIDKNRQGRWFRVPLIPKDPTTGFMFEPWVLADTMGLRPTSFLNARPISVFKRDSSSVWTFGLDRWGRRWVRPNKNAPVLPLSEE